MYRRHHPLSLMQNHPTAAPAPNRDPFLLILLSTISFQKPIMPRNPIRMQFPVCQPCGPQPPLPTIAAAAAKAATAMCNEREPHHEPQ